MEIGGLWLSSATTPVQAGPHWQDQDSVRSPLFTMTSPANRRPPWLNWLILAAFLWSSWQLAGLWATRLHG
jgi:hypothetical protein